MDCEELAVSPTGGLGLQRAKAAQELGRLKDRRAIRPLMTALTDKNSTVRYNAAYALAELGAAEAVPVVKPLIT